LIDTNRITTKAKGLILKNRRICMEIHC